jgi:carboxypeptidase Q
MFWSLAGLPWALLPAQTTDALPDVAAYRAVSQRIIAAALHDSTAFGRLAYLCDTFGPRLSGSDNLERAIDWILREMERDGLENVHGEAVSVPHWVRGAERLELLEPRFQPLAVLGLGGTIATPGEGITAEVLVVRDFDELSRRAAEAAGKIVVYNAPFTNYGETVRYRYRGAIDAALVGAVASLVRSVTPFSLNTPHTGAMSYNDTIPRIPHAAITLEAAEMLRRMQDRGERIVLRLQLEAETLPDTISRNVIAEWTGRERPEEVVVVGGHIDSWDVGQGAMDDAGGCMAAWEAVRLLKALELRPRRTIRVVLWTNEENGLRGATSYHDTHRDELSRHVLAIETDSGVFRPLGFGFSGSAEALLWLQAVGTLLDTIAAGEVTAGGGGADISPLIKSGVPGMGLKVEGSRYFWYHHTEADMLDKLDPGEFNRCVAALAVMVYVVADLPEPLPR